MNSYLKMSQAVLQKSHLPLTAREILEAAYRLQIVPEHLYGKTQHKTLHARLCEDILNNRTASLFERTAPGRFTLKSPIKNQDAASEYVAPRRSYQLKQFDVLCAKTAEIATSIESGGSPVDFQDIAEQFRYQVELKEAERDPNLVHVRLLVMISSEQGFLTLAALAGSEFGSGRTIGLLGFLRGSDTDLFAAQPFGIDLAVKRTIAEQSNARPHQIQKLTRVKVEKSLICIRIANRIGQDNSVVLVSMHSCEMPDEFIRIFPTSRAPRWAPIPAGVNDTASLDDISGRIVELLSNGELAIA